MDLDDSMSSGVWSQENMAFDDDAVDIYYEQIKPILTIFWRTGIRDIQPGDRMNQFLYKLAELYVLQHYWKHSDVLVNVEQALGGGNEFAQNTFGENIIDFYNAGKTQLRSYVQTFINNNV